MRRTVIAELSDSSVYARMNLPAEYRRIHMAVVGGASSLKTMVVHIEDQVFLEIYLIDLDLEERRQVLGALAGEWSSGQTRSR